MIITSQEVNKMPKKRSKTNQETMIDIPKNPEGKNWKNNDNCQEYYKEMVSKIRYNQNIKEKWEA